MLAEGLPPGWNVETAERDQGLVGEELQDEAKGRAIAGGDRRGEVGGGAVGGSDSGAEDEVNRLHGGVLLRFGKGMAGDALGKDDWRRNLAEGARWVDEFADDLGTGADEAAEGTGEEAFGEVAGGCGVAKRHGVFMVC